MATVSSVTKHFATAKEGFTTTLASTISSGAATVPLNSVTGYSNGEVVALVIEPTSATAKQVFTGTVDTAGVQITGVVWTEGTNQAHNAGVTVVDYWTATHQAMLVKGVKVSLDDDGTLKAGAVDTAAVVADSILTEAKFANGNIHGSDGYIDASETFTYVSASSFKITGTDVTAKFPVGTKIKLTQTTAKYFYVTSATFSTDTTVNITGGSDYSLANAAITSPMYSYMETPQGFPATGFNYTPTFANTTLGNGTVAGKFTFKGGKQHFRASFTLGSTSAVGAGATVSYPATSATLTTNAPLKGKVTCFDTSASSTYNAELKWASTTTATVVLDTVIGGVGTYVRLDGTSSTTPMTWATGDILAVDGEVDLA